MTTMNLTEALAVVKAAGYRISKPRVKKSKPLGLNAVGKPYSPQFDPNYKMKYHTPKLTNNHHSIGEGISPEKWALMCKLAQAEWDKTHKKTDDGIPEF